jgi:hypothetical protein
VTRESRFCVAPPENCGCRGQNPTREGNVRVTKAPPVESPDDSTRGGVDGESREMRTPFRNWRMASGRAGELVEWQSSQTVAKYKNGLEVGCVSR